MTLNGISWRIQQKMSVELGQRLSARWAMAQHLLRSCILLLPKGEPR